LKPTPGLDPVFLFKVGFDRLGVFEAVHQRIDHAAGGETGRENHDGDGLVHGMLLLRYSVIPGRASARTRNPEMIGASFGLTRTLRGAFGARPE
jgi:hypothetical protein